MFNHQRYALTQLYHLHSDTFRSSVGPVRGSKPHIIVLKGVLG